MPPGDIVCVPAVPSKNTLLVCESNIAVLVQSPPTYISLATVSQVPSELLKSPSIFISPDSCTIPPTPVCSTL